MAQKRRGGGRGGAFRPPELKGTLGTLLRTTLHQAGVVADAARDALGQGRARLDDARQARRRQDALAELGEVVLDLVRRGEIDVSELPEAREVLRRLEELDDGGGDAPDHDEPPGEIATAPARSRFDTRGRATKDDDGTVGSSWRPPKPARPLERVWRPPVAKPHPEDHDEPAAPPVRAKSGAAMPGAPKKGGISFEDDDEDLASYMHPDDVPPKPTPTEE
ncbi:MAG: hypothetical protein JNL83_01560 [Myxococcales bacterium]|nr:hypothetical protein [Myxococcales bacterium]